MTIKTVKKCVYLMFIMSFIFLAGCTPEKAKTLKTAVELFSNQAILAIDAVSQAIDAEVFVSEISEPEQTEIFVKKIIEFQETPNALNDFSILIQAKSPNAINIDAAVKNKKNKFIIRMRGNYMAFKQMFQSLETGSVLAKDAVEKTQKHAQSLIADIVAIADSYRTNPIMLIGQRSNIIWQVKNVLEDDSLNTAQKESRLTVLKVETDRVIETEKKIQQILVKSCAKAVATGLEVQKMIQGYGTLKIADLQNMLLRTVGIISSFTGKDYKNLLQHADVFFEKAKTDPYIGTAVDAALNEFNNL